MKRYFPVRIEGEVLGPNGPEVKILEGFFGYTNATFDLLFTEGGLDPLKHEEGRQRFGDLSRRVAKGQATEEERQELREFSTAEFFKSGESDARVLSILAWAGLREQFPEIKIEEVAKLLDGKQSRMLAQETIIPALFAYYGVDVEAAIKRTEDAIKAAEEAAAAEPGKD